MQFTQLFITGLLRLLCLVPVAILARRSFEKNSGKYLLLFCLLFLFDTILFGALLGEQNWNWLGNIARILWILIFLSSTGFLTKKDVGLTGRISQRKAVFLIILAATLLRLILRLAFKGTAGGYDVETLLYQSTMPGISEELLFRGVLLGLLNRAFTPRLTLLNTTLGWGIVFTSLLFGLIHGFAVNNHFAVDFNSQKFVMTTALGFLLGFLREKSKSIVPSVIMHNVWNVIAYWGM